MFEMEHRDLAEIQIKLEKEVERLKQVSQISIYILIHVNDFFPEKKLVSR